SVARDRSSLSGEGAGTEPELRRGGRRGGGSRRAGSCDSISRFAGGWGRRWRRGRRRPPPRGKDDQRDTPSEEEHAAYEHPDRDPEQERQLGPEVDVGSDAAGTVGVHEDHRPVAITHLPGHGLAPGARGGRRPEVLGGWRSPRRSPRNLTVGDPERIDLDVLDVGVCDAPEVAGDGRLWANPDEERLFRRAFSTDPYLAQPVVVPDPIRPTRVHLELLARQRVRRRREPLS